MDKKLTNSGPLRKPADKHSIYAIKISPIVTGSQAISAFEHYFAPNSVVPLPLGEGGEHVRVIPRNWLRVFRSADAARLGYGVRQERQTRAVQSEKCGARRGGVWDGMCVIVACFARALRRCTGSAYMHFLSILQEVRVICKTCNQLIL
jgi:hypothetical protein